MGAALKHVSVIREPLQTAVASVQEDLETRAVTRPPGQDSQKMHTEGGFPRRPYPVRTVGDLCVKKSGSPFSRILIAVIGQGDDYLRHPVVIAFLGKGAPVRLKRLSVASVSGFCGFTPLIIAVLDGYN